MILRHIINYYEGFEGEPELQIIQRDDTNYDVLTIKLWIGFFDSIVRLIEPNKDGLWEGVTLHYHTLTG